MQGIIHLPVGTITLLVPKNWLARTASGKGLYARIANDLQTRV